MSAKEASVNLGDIVKIKGGKRLPIGTSLQMAPNNHPYIRVRDMGSLYIPCHGLEYVPDDVYPKIQNYIVEENDLIISIVGTIGLVSIIDKRFHLASQTENCAKLTGLNNTDAKYLYYFLISDTGQQEIKEATVGAVQAKLPLYNIQKMQVTWPAPEIRSAIVKILSSIDEKIETNSKINQTLEQMAQAIFKSWFVDFDPVRAKMKGRQPEGMDAETAALFPDGFEESELGSIPKGWTVGTLSELCILNESSWNTKTIPDQLSYVDLANTKNGDITDIQSFSKAEAPSRARRILKAGDTIVGTVRPGNRSFALIGNTKMPLTASTGFAVLSPKSPIYRELVYQVGTSEANISRLSHLADGGAYPAVRPEIVVDEECVIVPHEIVYAFHSQVSNLFNQILANRAQDRTLAMLRDALLPKLLSGEITALR